MTPEQAIADNKALQSMMNSKWWKIFADTLKAQRRARTLDILNNKLLDEKNLSQADVFKEQIRTYSFILEIPNLIKKSNDAIIPAIDLDNIDEDLISSEDADDLFVDVTTE